MKQSQTYTALPDCLWQQAGVVKTKPCFKDFECSACRFDRAMNHVCRKNEALKKQGNVLSGRSAGFIFWQDKLMTKPLGLRPCIHHMKGHIKFKNCPKAYHCVDCEFDQYFYDQFKVNTVLQPVDFDDIHGISLPAGFYLHQGHTWIKIEGNGIVRMGIDDFAARLLGKFDAADPPVIGKQLEQGRPAVAMARQGRKVTFVSPASGVITQVNPKIKKDPGLVHSSPYTDGWILMMHCPNLKADLKHLFFMDSSTQFMKEKVEQLYNYIEEKTQLKAADGGNLVPDIYGSLDNASWQELVDRFIVPSP